MLFPACFILSKFLTCIRILVDTYCPIQHNVTWRNMRATARS